ADAFDQFYVPGLSEPGRRREAGRRLRSCETEMVVACPLRADPMRTVGQHRRSQSGSRFGRPERGPAAEGCLLLKGEFGQWQCHHRSFGRVLETGTAGCEDRREPTGSSVAVSL